MSRRIRVECGRDDEVDEVRSFLRRTNGMCSMLSISLHLQSLGRDLKKGKSERTEVTCLIRLINTLITLGSCSFSNMRATLPILNGNPPGGRSV